MPVRLGVVRTPLESTQWEYPYDWLSSINEPVALHTPCGRSWPVAVRQFRENKYFNTQIPPAVKDPIADRRNLSACVNFR